MHCKSSIAVASLSLISVLLGPLEDSCQNCMCFAQYYELSDLGYLGHKSHQVVRVVAEMVLKDRFLGPD